MLFCKIPEMHLSLSNIYDRYFCKNSEFVIDIGHSSNAFELVDVPYYKEVWLSLTSMYEGCECFRKIMAKLIAFLRKRRKAAHHYLPHQLHFCYKVVEGSKKKDCEKGRSSHPDVFCKKGALKNFTTFTGKYQLWSLFQIMLQVLKDRS